MADQPRSTMSELVKVIADIAKSRADLAAILVIVLFTNGGTLYIANARVTDLITAMTALSSQMQRVADNCSR